MKKKSTEGLKLLPSTLAIVTTIISTTITTTIITHTIIATTFTTTTIITAITTTTMVCFWVRRSVRATVIVVLGG